MAKITIHGKPQYTDGCLPAIGQELPRFKLTNTNWVDVTVQSCGDGHKLLELFPTVYAPGVSDHVRSLLKSLPRNSRARVLVISNDLPPALDLWRISERLDNVVVLSAFRSDRFGRSCGVSINSGPYRGLTARASFIVDGQDRVLHVDLVRDLIGEFIPSAGEHAASRATAKLPEPVTVSVDTAVTV